MKKVIVVAFRLPLPSVWRPSFCPRTAHLPPVGCTAPGWSLVSAQPHVAELSAMSAVTVPAWSRPGLGVVSAWSRRGPPVPELITVGAHQQSMEVDWINPLDS